MDQNDIDAVLNDPGGSEGSGSEASGGLTQADIDAALGDAGSPSAPSGGQSGASRPEPAAAEGSVVDSGGVSQEDIDVLTAATGEGTGDQSGPTEKATAQPDERLDSSGRKGVGDLWPERPEGCCAPKVPDPFSPAAMAGAIAEQQAAAAPTSPPPVPESQRAQDLELPTFDHEEVSAEARHPIDLLHDVDLHVKIELGRTEMLVEDVLQLGEGSVVELEKLAGDPVDVLVNDRLVARGEVLVLNDNFCVRVSEIMSDADTGAVG